MKKTKVNGVFPSSGEGYRKEWTFNKRELIKLTNVEFADQVEKEFEDMHDAMDFQAELYYVDHTKPGQEKHENYYVCLGHFIYTHILIFNPKNGYIRTDILNHDYFNNIVKPFMTGIKSR